MRESHDDKKLAYIALFIVAYKHMRANGAHGAAAAPSNNSFYDNILKYEI